MTQGNIGSVAGTTLNAALHPENFSSPDHRREVFGESLEELSRIAQGTIDSFHHGESASASVVGGLGVYGMRHALGALVERGVADHEVAHDTSRALQRVCAEVRKAKGNEEWSNRQLCALAGIGMANVVWHGIAGGDLDIHSGFVTTMRSPADGVDLVVTPRGAILPTGTLRVVPERFSDGPRYEEASLISSRELLEARDVRKAVAKTLSWDSQPRALMAGAYDRLGRKFTTLPVLATDAS